MSKDRSTTLTLRDEWPTLILLGITYAAFAALTYFAPLLPLALVILCLAFVIAMHSSLQHEVLHGHPFTSKRLSDLTVFLALGLFVPYLRFKDTHLAHHYDPNLTDPYDDPESNYLDAVQWHKMPLPLRILAQANNTLFGRMVLGPALSLAPFYGQDLRRLIRGERRIWRSYLEHALSVGLVLAWLSTFSTLPLWAYSLSAYLGMSLLKVRTFLEHQAHDRAAARSVIIEDKGPLALLFLNNNYHAVHHAHPQVVWHKLPRLFQDKRHHFLRRNGGYSYQSYGEVFAKFLFRAKDPVTHPFWSSDNRSQPVTRK